MNNFFFSQETIDQLIETARGRPTKYDPETMIPKVIGMLAEGESLAWVTTELGIATDTFWRWRKKYKEFSEAVQIGKRAAEAIWSKKGEMALTAEKFQPALYQMQMRNRFDWDRNILDKKHQLPDWDDTLPIADQIKQVKRSMRKKEVCPTVAKAYMEILEKEMNATELKDAISTLKKVEEVIS